MITITEQPENCQTQMGKFTEFNVTALSNYEITYQWECREYNYLQFVPIIGKTEAYCKFVLNVNYGWEYRCKLTDQDGTVYTRTVTTVQKTVVPAQGFENGWYYEEAYGIFTDGSYRLHNIQRFVNRLSWWGWTMNAIAAVAGNVWIECDTSPGTWQDFDYMYGPNQDHSGYGFVQWTPVFELTNWCVEFYPDIEWRNNGELQLARLYYEWKNNLMWEQWDAFVHSELPVEDLTVIFITGYLGVQEGQETTLPIRLQQADWIYNNITPCPAPWILKKITERGKKGL